MSRARQSLLAPLFILALLLPASAATAASFSISPAGSISSVSLGLTTFENELGTITCRLTLNGSLVRGPIAKVEGTDVGAITEGRISECASALGRIKSFEILLTLPWRFHYRFIRGTLPEQVLGVLLTVVDLAVLLVVETIFGDQRCLYRGDIGIEIELIGANPFRTSLFGFLTETLRVTPLGGSRFCGVIGRMIGRYGIAPQQNLQRT